MARRDRRVVAKLLLQPQKYMADPAEAMPDCHAREWDLQKVRFNRVSRWQRSPIRPPRRDPEDHTCLVTGITDHEQQPQKSRLHLLKFLGTDLPGQLPAPDSEAFFRLYGESLWDWLWAAITTCMPLENGLHRGVSMFLNRAAARVRHFDEKNVRTEMVFPSLLSAFVEMYFHDREGGTILV